MDLELCLATITVDLFFLYYYYVNFTASYAQKKLSGLETKDWVSKEIADRLTPILEQLMCII